MVFVFGEVVGENQNLENSVEPTETHETDMKITSSDTSICVSYGRLGCNRLLLTKNRPPRAASRWTIVSWHTPTEGTWPAFVALAREILELDRRMAEREKAVSPNAPSVNHGGPPVSQDTQQAADGRLPDYVRDAAGMLKFAVIHRSPNAPALPRREEDRQ